MKKKEPACAPAKRGRKVLKTPVELEEKITDPKPMPEPELAPMELQKEVAIEDDADQELIDCVNFSSGQNVLSIRFSKKKSNRMYRVQIFLNDAIEIRPVTYAGASTGLTFWQMLKTNLRGK